MTIHFLNCFSCHARWPRHWKSGTLCLLVESNQGLVLVDTGLGQADYLSPSGIMHIFDVITITPLDAGEAAIRQISRLGFKPEEVRHIILTHMHFDHCGGLPDFPHARVHVHRREYEAFLGRPRSWLELAYNRRHIAHAPEWVLHDGAGEKWFDFDAIHLTGFEPEMWLVPLHGHTPGHCGVAIRLANGWFFHVADAGPIEMTEEAPRWLVRLVLGAHPPLARLCQCSSRSPHDNRSYVAIFF